MEKRKVRNGNIYIVEAHLQKFDGMRWAVQLPKGASTCSSCGIGSHRL